VLCWLNRPNKARLGFTGMLGLRLSRPARAYGLAMRSGPAQFNRPAHGPSPSPLSLMKRAQGAAPHAPPPPTGGARLSVSLRIWCGCQIRCGRQRWSCVRVSQRVCGKRPGRVRRMAALAWPRRERDVAVSVRGHRAQQGCGGVMARRRQDIAVWERTRAGGSLASQGRGTTWR
jgi:hypothetical protein